MQFLALDLELFPRLSVAVNGQFIALAATERRPEDARRIDAGLEALDDFFGALPGREREIVSVEALPLLLLLDQFDLARLFRPDAHGLDVPPLPVRLLLVVGLPDADAGVRELAAEAHLAAVDLHHRRAVEAEHALVAPLHEHHARVDARTIDVEVVLVALGLFAVVRRELVTDLLQDRVGRLRLHADRRVALSLDHRHEVLERVLVLPVVDRLGVVALHVDVFMDGPAALHVRLLQVHADGRGRLLRRVRDLFGGVRRRGLGRRDVLLARHLRRGGLRGRGDGLARDADGRRRALGLCRRRLRRGLCRVALACTKGPLPQSSRRSRRE